MIEPDKLVAFAVVTTTTSIVPGPSMMFVMSQAIWRGSRSGWAALLGMQLGYIVWWILAAFGLGTLAAAYPRAFRSLALVGLAYLAWLGIKAIRNSFEPSSNDYAKPGLEPSHHAFRDGAVVAFGNPKSLIYMVAIIPPFVNPQDSIGAQITILAVVALIADLAIGTLYIGAGKRVASAMERVGTRRWIDRAIGTLFLIIAALILLDLVGG